MRVSNIVYPPRRPAALGQYGPYQTPTWVAPREAAFKFIDEEGFHNTSAGKKFPYQISNVVAADGSPLNLPPITGTALSEEGSIVRIPIQIQQGAAGSIPIGGQPVNATLSLWKVYKGIQYPLFQNRRLLFTVPPAAPLPLNLEAIYASYVADKAAAEAEAYARETARLDQEMLEQYEAQLRTEATEAARQKAAAEAQAAAERAAIAAADAAAKKKAADDAVEEAVNAEAARNKKLLLTVGGVGVLGLLGYLIFKS